MPDITLGRWRDTMLRQLRRRGVDIQRAASWTTRAGGPCRVETLVDVGFAFGTPELYDLFPARRLVCVDALQEYERHAEPLRQRFEQVDFVAVGVGSSEATISLQISSAEPTKSSFGTRVDPLVRPVDETRDVRVTTLDHLSSTMGLAGPIALKIDTEGWELEALRGSTETLLQCSHVVLESSVLPRFEGGYGLTELVTFMADHGFHVSAVLTARPRRDARIPFLDLLFQRKS